MIYKGTHSDEGIGPGRVVYVDKGEEYSLPPRNDLYNHSPDGFNWGYGGSGPGQLALALCAHNLGLDMPQEEADQLALTVYQKVKWHTSALWASGKEWAITAFTLRALIEALRSSR